MGDAHQMVVHHVGEVVGGHAVGLDEDLVIQRGVVHLDVAVHHVLKAGGAGFGHFLADDVGKAGVQLCLHLLGRKAAAVTVVVGSLAAGFLYQAHFIQTLLVAEAVISLAFFHKLLGIALEHAHAFTLHIGADGAADVRPLVPDEARFAQGIVDDVHRTLHITLLVGVFDAQNKRSAGAFGF